MFRGATAGRRLAPAFFGADSIATRSEKSGNFGFLDCCVAPASPARFSPEACDNGVGTKLNEKGIASTLRLKQKPLMIGW